MKRTLGVVTIAASLVLSGCTTFQGPQRLMAFDAQPAKYPGRNIDMFIDDFNKAKAFRNANPNATNPFVPQMMRSGFMYNYSFCESYFTRAVQNQRRANIVRSILPPISALITGIIGFSDFSNNPGAKEDLVGALALGSVAATATLNIYDEHFLFGAENIGAVQNLALKSVDAHGSKALEQQQVSFERAVQHLIDNQDQCSPSTILSLARTVIKEAKLTATNHATPEGALEAIGRTETAPGKVTVSLGE